MPGASINGLQFQTHRLKELAAIVAPGEKNWHRILITSLFAIAPWGIGKE